MCISTLVDGLHGVLAIVGLGDTVDRQGVDVVLFGDLQGRTKDHGLSVVAPLELWLRGTGDDGLKLDRLSDLAEGCYQRLDNYRCSHHWLLGLGLRRHVEDKRVSGLTLAVPCCDLVGASVLLLDIGDLDDGAVHVHV